ncbi:hypothetical protein AB0M23_31015 [Streptomyces sp. NPDC052077]|uniref:hypothetical protein n=1 Tax=Streptomyces sp. NPDC052077 TaxID=3154757 RepID=UPI003421D75D
MDTCAICPRTAPDGSRACPVCADDLHAWLAEIPRQAALLEEEFVAPSAAPARGRLGGTGRAHAPAPADLRVLTLLGPGRYDPAPGTDDDGTAPITAVLAAWAGHIAYWYPAVTRDAHGTAHTQPCDQAWPAEGRGITSWCTWHTRYLPYTLALPLTRAYHEQISDLVHRLRALTHTTPRRRAMAAPCPSCDAGGLTWTDGQWRIVCQVCGHHLTPEAYDEHAAAVLRLRTGAALSA